MLYFDTIKKKKTELEQLHNSTQIFMSHGFLPILEIFAKNVIL